MCDGPMIKLLSDRIELGMKKFDYENHSYLFLAMSCGFFVSKNKSSRMTRLILSIEDCICWLLKMVDMNLPGTRSTNSFAGNEILPGKTFVSLIVGGWFKNSPLS